MADDGLPPGAPRSPGVSPPEPRRPGGGSAEEEASAADLVQSVAGEEDPGSALEQFSDLMHGSPDESHLAAERPDPSLSPARGAAGPPSPPPGTNDGGT